MATLEDVRRIALSLPETVEVDELRFQVRKKSFCWERPLRPRDVADLEQLGQRIPTGELLGVRVPSDEKEELLASVEAFFTIPHFDGFPAVLLELARVDADELTEIVTDAWLVQAPKRLAKEFLAN